jgi:eukaryotic-like serine/threonine-protein kinase
MPDPTASSALPTYIAGYRIGRVLGGGMSTVYLARNPTLPQWEALKVLPAERARNPAVRARFLQEGETTARLGHQNVVAIYGRGETEDGQLWIAMQYVAGTDAEAALQAGAMTPLRAMRIVGEVAKVLDYAHPRGVVHQDVKPSNVLLGARAGEQERVVLSDFGAALTPQSSDPADSPMVASLAYAAPEVIMGNPVDGRADVYSLGCTLFRLLTGRYPFPGDGGISATITAHLEQAPPRPSDFLPWASPQLDGVIARALAKNPAHRYATAGGLAAAAAAALPNASPTPVPSYEPTAAPPPGNVEAPTYRAGAFPPPVRPRSRPVTSNRNLVVVGGIAAVVLVVALAVWLLIPTPTPAPSPAASSPTTTTTAANDAVARLTRLLPAGYPAGTCAPAAAADAAAAAVMSCGPNLDPGGPGTATYTLARSPESLQAALQRVISTARMVVCPRNIQSPGPWRRLANPAVAQGTVFCAISGGRPLVAWTNDAQLLLASTRSQNPDGGALDQLYTWWGTHS